jgi:hypothetical protein
MLVMPDDFAVAAEELRALLAFDSAPDVIDDFINLVERLPIASKAQASKLAARTKALAAVSVAVIHYQIAFTHVNARRANAGGDFLRQFRDLKKWPTKRRLLNILERDKDENDLRPAESAILLWVRIRHVNNLGHVGHGRVQLFSLIDPRGCWISTGATQCDQKCDAIQCQEFSAHGSLWSACHPYSTQLNSACHVPTH